MSVRFLVLAGLIAGTITVAACGGGNGESQRAEKPRLTHTAYVKRANALCRSISQNVPEFPGKQSGKGYVTTASLVIPYLKEVLRLNSGALVDLRALRPPLRDAGEHQKLITAQGARIKNLQAALGAAKRRDGRKFTAAIQRDQNRDQPAYLAAAAHLGLTACTGQS
jgi:hypothetical protein